MESKLHQLIVRYYEDKRYRNGINILLCLVSLAMIYRLGYVVGRFFYYVQQNFFSWFITKILRCPKKNRLHTGLIGQPFYLCRKEIRRADGKADQTDLYIILAFGIGGNRRTGILAV